MSVFAVMGQARLVVVVRACCNNAAQRLGHTRVSHLADRVVAVAASHGMRPAFRKHRHAHLCHKLRERLNGKCRLFGTGSAFNASERRARFAHEKKKHDMGL